MGVMNSTDDALAKAAERELIMLAETDPEKRAAAKKSANSYFRRAMKNDGNEDYAEDVLD